MQSKAHCAVPAGAHRRLSARQAGRHRPDGATVRGRLKQKRSQSTHLPALCRAGLCREDRVDSEVLALRQCLQSTGHVASPYSFVAASLVRNCCVARAYAVSACRTTSSSVSCTLPSLTKYILHQTHQSATTASDSVALGCAINALRALQLVGRRCSSSQHVTDDTP